MLPNLALSGLLALLKFIKFDNISAIKNVSQPVLSKVCNIELFVCRKQSVIQVQSFQGSNSSLIEFLSEVRNAFFLMKKVLLSILVHLITVSCRFNEKISTSSVL